MKSIRDEIHSCIQNPDSDLKVNVVEKNVIIEKNYHDFANDVISRAGEISAQVGSLEGYVIACIGRNSYANLVNTFASFYLDRPTFILSSEEPFPRQQDRIRALGFKSVVVHEGQAKISVFESNKNAEDAFVYVASSGTTGVPKVVKLSQQAVFNNVQALQKHHNISDKSVILTPLPIFHVNALFFTVLTSFKSRSTFYLIDGFDVNKIKDVLSKRRVEIVSLVPSVIHALNRFDQFVDWKLTGVRYLVSAAAPLSVALLKSWYLKTGVKIVQGYGMSESVNFSCTLPVDLPEDEYRFVMMEQSFPSIGVELEGIKLSIRGADGVNLENDQIGEIIHEGDSLMSGYIGESQPKEIQSGDLGFYKMVNGKRYFFITGRAKDIIKKGGHSISLREIDDFLLACPEMEGDVVSVPIEDPLYIENFGLVFSQPLSPKEIQNLTKKLVQHFGDLYHTSKIVSTFEPLRTASGKALRSHLKKLF